MGKIMGSKESSGSLSDSRRARSKKDSNGTTAISAIVREKFAWILQGHLPVVRCEKLYDSKLPAVCKTSSPFTLPIRNYESNLNILSSSQKNSNLTKDSSNSKVSACATQNQSSESKETVIQNAALKTSSLQSSQKRSKVKNTGLHVKSLASASQERINDKTSENRSIATTEGGSSEKESRKVKVSEKVSKRSKVEPRKCTKDPDDSPCDGSCCVDWNEDESRKKNSKKRENESFSCKREKSSKTTKANSSQSIKLDSERKTITRKRTECRKPRTKGKETRQEGISKTQNREDSQLLKITSKKVAVFTPKNSSEDGSLSPFLVPISNSPITTIRKLGETSPSSKIYSYMNQTNSIHHVRSGISFSLPPQNSTNLSSQTLSNIQPSQEKPTSKPIRCLETSFCTNTMMTKRRKPKDGFFPGFPSIQADRVSESKTTHPKAISVNTQSQNSQNQMLEGATFPKANDASHSNNQYSYGKIPQNYNLNSMLHISPLSCEENETNVRPPTNFGRNRFNLGLPSNRIGNQSLSQANKIQLSKNSVPRILNFKTTINDTEYSEKDRFRHLPVGVGGTSEGRMEINPDANDFTAGDTLCTTGSDVIFNKDESMLENQMSYLECLKQEQLPGTLDNPGENPFDLGCSTDSDSEKMETLHSHIEENIIPNILPQQTKPKIMKCETVPSDFIQILHRSQMCIKTENLSFEESGGEGQLLGYENSADDQKIAILKINNAEQLFSTDLQESQKSDEYMNDDNSLNLGLTARQASAMLNSNMVPDLENVWKNGLDFFTCDDLLGEDIDNNNEKMLPQSNGNIIEPVEIREPKPFLGVGIGFEDKKEMVMEVHEDNSISHPVERIEQEPSLNVVNRSEAVKETECTQGPLSQIMQLLTDNPYPCTKTKKSKNAVNNCLSNDEETTYTASNLEELNSAAGTSEGFPNFKEPDWKSVNSANEGVNSQCNFSSNYRKRRWFDNKEAVKQSGKKNVKLKRRKWNHCANEGEYTDTSSEISSSCRSSLNDSDHKLVNCTEMYDDNHSDLQDCRVNTGVQNSVPQNFAEPLRFGDFVFLGEQKKIKETKVETVVQTKFETNQPRFESKVIEADPVKESLVDPEPEAERGDLDSQPRNVAKAKNSPIRRKKRRALCRSKFSPSNYSNSSSESSDEEFTKKYSSSEEEVESKHHLLKVRLQRELQEMSENSNSQIIDTPITGEDEQNEQDDILSVFASPSLMFMEGMSSRCPSPIQLPKTGQNSDYSDNTGDSYFDAFQRKNLEECSRDLRSMIDSKRGTVEKKDQAGCSSLADNPDNLFTKPFPPLIKIKNQNKPLPNLDKKLIVFDQVIPDSRPPVSRVFYGVCHQYLSCGVCAKKHCAFQNKIPDRLMKFSYHREEDVLNIICDGIKTDFRFYVKSVYKSALKMLSKDICLKLFTEVCNAKYLDEVMLQDTVEALRQKQWSIVKICRELAEQPLEPQIAPLYHSLLLNIAANRAQKNEYWETLCPFINKVTFSPSMLEQILQQCMSDKGNESRILAVYEYFWNTNSYQAVTLDSWIPFCKLRGELADKERKETPENSDAEFYINENNIVNQGIASPDAAADFQSTYHNGFYNSVENPVNKKSCNNSSKSDINYKLMPIENLAPPESNIRERDNFWKLYDNLESLRNGLKHNDYEHVVNILKQYEKAERTLFTRHCYKVLATEINKSQAHVENTIRIAVQTGEIFELRGILYRLGTYVLVNLADQGLWVHAYELLKTLQTYSLHKNNAAFTILAAEICLANHRYLKALTLLKQNNIIFTNCKKWKVESNEADVHLRTSTVTLLLESLCKDFSEKAFFIFDLILGEQPSNSSPVDLTRVVDKLMVSLIAQNHIDLVMILCKKAMRYHLNFHETTFHAVITLLVPKDLVLARQFYQYATLLGVYSPIKLVYPLTRVIINVDWSEEEMYIVVLEFLKKLFLNIGFTASHLGPYALGVYFVFEIVPNRKQLYHEDSDSKREENERINKSKSMMRDILERRFDPSIRFVKKEKGRICKINSRSLVEYLKAGHVAD